MKTLRIAIAFMLLAPFGVAPAHAQDGSIVSWGRYVYSDYGQGIVPAPNTDFVAVAAGCTHSLGLESDGTIVAWGYSAGGACNVPAPNAGFVAIAAGGQHSLGLKSDGTILAWGWNEHGQCNVPSPNAGFVAVAGGGWHSLGLKTDGTIVAWGANGSGQCDVPSPNADFIAIAAGSEHSIGLKSDGSIAAWGWNGWEMNTVPAPNAGFIAIAAGQEHNMGLKSDGSIVVWGFNADGRWTVPEPNSGFVAITAGSHISLGLRSSGAIAAWGTSEYGQLNLPSPNSGFVAIAAGCYHCLGLKSLTPMQGACCHTDGTCTLTLQSDCTSLSSWEGAGTSCTPNLCSATPVLLESWAASSLPEGLQIRWEVPLGTTGALYRAWRDPVAGSQDVVPTPEAVLLASEWTGASAEGTVETLDPEAPRGAVVRYFLEVGAGGGEFIGPVAARWDPPAAAWSAGPTPFRDSVRLTPPGAGLAHARIFDAGGRLVRSLVRPDGNAPIEWDSRDDTGRALPAGVYVVKVTGPAGETSGRVVLSR